MKLTVNSFHINRPKNRYKNSASQKLGVEQLRYKMVLKCRNKSETLKSNNERDFTSSLNY